MNNTDISAHMALVKKWHDDVLSPWEDQSWEAVEASARKLAAAPAIHTLQGTPTEDGGCAFTIPTSDAFATLPATAAGPSDAERLDYLQGTGSTVELLPPFKNGFGNFRIGGLHKAVSSDIRAAIDAAIRATKGGKL